MKLTNPYNILRHLGTSKRGSPSSTSIGLYPADQPAIKLFIGTPLNPTKKPSIILLQHSPAKASQQ